MTETTTEAPIVKAGDFFYCSWGYDQTNIDFYKVIAVTKSGKSAKVQEWSSKSISDEGAPQVSVVPGDGPRQEADHSNVDQNADYWDRQKQIVMRDAPIVTKRLRFGGYSKASFYVASYADAYFWDGTAKSKTGFGWGH